MSQLLLRVLLLFTALSVGQCGGKCDHPNLFTLGSTKCLVDKQKEFGVCFVCIIVVTLALEHLMKSATQWAERDEALTEVGATVIKELAILGVISFTIFIMEQAFSIQRTDFYVPLEFAHVFIFFIAVVFVLQACFMLLMSTRSSRRNDAALGVRAHEFEARSLAETPRSNASGRPAPLRWWDLGRWRDTRWREAAEMHIIRRVFINKHRLPGNFDFVRYLQRAFNNKIMRMLDIGPRSWCGATVLGAAPFGLCALLGVSAAAVFVGSGWFLLFTWCAIARVSQVARRHTLGESGVPYKRAASRMGLVQHAMMIMADDDKRDHGSDRWAQGSRGAIGHAGLGQRGSTASTHGTIESFISKTSPKQGRARRVSSAADALAVTIDEARGVGGVEHASVTNPIVANNAAAAAVAAAGGGTGECGGGSGGRIAREAPTSGVYEAEEGEGGNEAGSGPEQQQPKTSLGRLSVMVGAQHVEETEEAVGSLAAGAPSAAAALRSGSSGSGRLRGLLKAPSHVKKMLRFAAAAGSRHSFGSSEGLPTGERARTTTLETRNAIFKAAEARWDLSHHFALHPDYISGLLEVLFLTDCLFKAAYFTYFLPPLASSWAFHAAGTSVLLLSTFLVQPLVLRCFFFMQAVGKVEDDVLGGTLEDMDEGEKMKAWLLHKINSHAQREGRVLFHKRRGSVRTHSNQEFLEELFRGWASIRGGELMITRAQLKNVLTNVEVRTSRVTFAKLWRMLDKGQRGKISFNQFTGFLMSVSVTTYKRTLDQKMSFSVARPAPNDGVLSKARALTAQGAQSVRKAAARTQSVRQISAKAGASKPGTQRSRFNSRALKKHAPAPKHAASTAALPSTGAAGALNRSVGSRARKHASSTSELLQTSSTVRQPADSGDGTLGAIQDARRGTAMV